MNPTREPLAFRIPLEYVKQLRAVRERHHVPITTQIELALRDWWRKNGFELDDEKKSARRRARPRRRASARKQR
jgi:hypothetical protein